MVIPVATLLDDHQ